MGEIKIIPAPQIHLAIMSYGDVKSNSGLKALNEDLASKGYIEGFMPTSTDCTVFSQLASAPTSFPHALRWYNHIASFSAAEKSAFPAGTKTAEPAPKQEKAPAMDFGDEEDSEEEEEEEEETEAMKARRLKIEAEKKKQEAKKNKKPVVGKSEVKFDVKPWDDETDMVELERLVRTIKMEGLVWGFGELKDVAFGVKKRQITCVVVDDLVSTDDLEEEIKNFDEYVQSVDTHAFSKI